MCQISDDLSCIAGTHKKWPLALYRKGTFVIQHNKLRPSLQVVLTWQKEKALNAYIWFVFTYLNSWKINIDQLDRTGFGKASCWCQKWHQVSSWSCGKPWCVTLEWREKKNPSVTTKSQQYGSLSLVFFFGFVYFFAAEISPHYRRRPHSSHRQRPGWQLLPFIPSLSSPRAVLRSARQSRVPSSVTTRRSLTASGMQR